MNLGQLRKMVSELEELPNEVLIVLQVEYGYGCSMTVTDVDMSVTEIPDFDSNEEDLEMSVVSFNGVEDKRYEEM